MKLFIRQHKDDDVRTLALQSKRYPNIDMQLAIRQIGGAKIAKDKIPTWYTNEDVIYPQSLSMEQCSSEHTARYKAALTDGDSMVDLTGGLGVDTFFLAFAYDKAVYVEQQSELAEIATHNFKSLGISNIDVINTDSLTYLDTMKSVDLIYIDPARRSVEGRKTVLIEDCTPNIIEIEQLLDAKARQVMIKLSPMLDISLAIQSLTNVSAIHIISVNNECKELLFIKNEEQNDFVKFHCVNIQKEKTDVFTFDKESEKRMQVPHTSLLDKYLYEPNSSILKAGAYKSIAYTFSLKKLHQSSHLYTSDTLHDDFQGRRFEIIAVCTLNKNDIRKHFSYITKANVATRNFPLSPEELKKRIGLKDGGDMYIFGTTLADDTKVVIICKKA